MKIPASQAAQTYSLAKTALKTAAPTTPNASQKPETNAAFNAVHELTSTVAQSEKAAQSLMTGKADPHSVVEAMAAAELAVETAVTVRNKVVEAYQELIRMPV